MDGLFWTSRRHWWKRVNSTVKEFYPSNTSGSSREWTRATRLIDRDANDCAISPPPKIYHNAWAENWHAHIFCACNKNVIQLFVKHEITIYSVCSCTSCNSKMSWISSYQFIEVTDGLTYTRVPKCLLHWTWFLNNDWSCNARPDHVCHSLPEITWGVTLSRERKPQLSVSSCMFLSPVVLL